MGKRFTKLRFAWVTSEFLSARNDGDSVGSYSAPVSAPAAAPAPAADSQSASFTAVETDDLPF